MSSTASHGLQNPGRKQQISVVLTEMFAKLFGKSPAELDVNASMVDLGGDSLFLLQASNAMRERFNVKIPFRLLLEELSTIDSLAAHLDQKLPPEAAISAAGVSSPSPQVPSPSQAAIPPASLGQKERMDSAVQPVLAQQIVAISGMKNTIPEGDPIYQIFAQQLALMAQQITILSGQPNVAPQDSTVMAPQPVLPQSKLVEIQASAEGQAKPSLPSEIEPEVYVPYQPIQAEGNPVNVHIFFGQQAGFRVRGVVHAAQAAPDNLLA